MCFIFIVTLESNVFVHSPPPPMYSLFKISGFTGTTQTRFEHKSNGNAAFTKKKFTKRLRNFTKAIDQDPYDHVFYSNRSSVLRHCWTNTRKRARTREDAGIETRLCERVLSIRFCLVQVRILPRFYPRVYARAHTLDPKNLALMEGMGEAKLAQKKKIEEAKLASKMNNATLDEYVIGIDLGTTYSCVSVWKDGEAHVLSNAEGDRTTASWVSFTEAGRVVGESAKRASRAKPEEHFVQHQEKLSGDSSRRLARILSTCRLRSRKVREVSRSSSSKTRPKTTKREGICPGANLHDGFAKDESHDRRPVGLRHQQGGHHRPGVLFRRAKKTNQGRPPNRRLGSF